MLQGVHARIDGITASIRTQHMGGNVTLEAMSVRDQRTEGRQVVLRVPGLRPGRHHPAGGHDLDEVGPGFDHLANGANYLIVRVGA